MKAFSKKLFTVRFDLRKYSRLGIASFLVAILTGLIVIMDIGLALRYQNDPAVIRLFERIDPWLTWLAAFTAFSGIVLGIAATAQKQRERLFGLVGLIANGLFLLGILSLYIASTLAFWRVAGTGG